MAATSRAICSIACHRRACSGRKSCVPLGAWKRGDAMFTRVNIEHRTSNIEGPRDSSAASMLDVGCSMFDVHLCLGRDGSRHILSLAALTAGGADRLLFLLGGRLELLDLRFGDQGVERLLLAELKEEGGQR